MRVHWAERMFDLLSSDGKLVCLEFPMYKDRSLPGPPWGLNGVHWNLLAEGCNGIIDESSAHSELKGKFKRDVYIKPGRTYEMGSGTDMLSVWSKKSH